MKKVSPQAISGEPASSEPTTVSTPGNVVETKRVIAAWSICTRRNLPKAQPWPRVYSQVAYTCSVQVPPRSGARRAGSGRGVNRYTEACLLLLLAERPGHGYELAERL